MVGLGGIWIEVLADVAFALAPLDHADARALLTRLRGHALLTGARGASPVDLDALADVIVGAGDALAAADGVSEIDLNPVLATPDRAVAVDWKVT
jgi:acyl-CoA synthetase (NDP forming)